VRFLLDMGISPKTAVFLIQSGHEASHLVSEGLERLPDPEILGKARRENAVLLTHDLDFADLLAASGDDLPSVIIFRLRSMRPQIVNRYLEMILSQHEERLRQGVILSVTDASIRSRALPLLRE
jgi:predicted nuclease of predicted toxin-antitoxin system